MTNLFAENLDRLLSSLSAASLSSTVISLAQAGGRPQEGVSLQALMDHLQGDLDLGTGREGWGHQLRLKRALVALVAETPGLRFVEGDA